jgi:hypothetical protein
MLNPRPVRPVAHRLAVEQLETRVAPSVVVTNNASYATTVYTNVYGTPVPGGYRAVAPFLDASGKQQMEVDLSPVKPVILSKPSATFMKTLQATFTAGNGWKFDPAPAAKTPILTVKSYWTLAISTVSYIVVVAGMATATLKSYGTPAKPITFNTTGTHKIRATYDGNGNWNGISNTYD